MTGRSAHPDQDPAARRARYFLYVLGGTFIMVGFSLEMVPVIAAVTPWWSGRACASVAVVFLAIGRFGSDRFVRRCESLLTGWL